MRILFTGGGTGGHFFPILALIREIKRVAEDERILDLEVFYMSADDLGARLLDEEEVVRIKVRSGKWRPVSSAQEALLNLRDMLGLFVGFGQALWDMFFFLPEGMLFL